MSAEGVSHWKERVESISSSGKVIFLFLKELIEEMYQAAAIDGNLNLNAIDWTEFMNYLRVVVLKSYNEENIALAIRHADESRGNALTTPLVRKWEFVIKSVDDPRYQQ